MIQLNAQLQCSLVQESYRRKVAEYEMLNKHFQRQKAELADLEESYRLKTIDALRSISQLQREVMLLDLVIAHYIPEDHQAVILQHCQEEDDLTWSIRYASYAGNYVNQCLAHPDGVATAS